LANDADGHSRGFVPVAGAAPPYNQRGCVAQAWSVAEILRSYIEQKDAELQDERNARGEA
jgi:glycogen debranching enzyme